MMFGSPFARPAPTLDQVISDLKAKGYQIDRADVPGLYIVSGPDLWGVELTEGQLFSLLNQPR